MEIIAVPHAALHEQVSACNRLIVDESLDATGNAQRVVERPRGVDHGIDERTLELGTDAVAETRTQQQHLVTMMQPAAVLARLYCRPEFHLKLKMVVLTNKDSGFLAIWPHFMDII